MELNAKCFDTGYNILFLYPRTRAFPSHPDESCPPHKFPDFCPNRGYRKVYTDTGKKISVTGLYLPADRMTYFSSSSVSKSLPQHTDWKTGGFFLFRRRLLGRHRTSLPVFLPFRFRRRDMGYNYNGHPGDWPGFSICPLLPPIRLTFSSPDSALILFFPLFLYKKGGIFVHFIILLIPFRILG